MYYCGNYFTMKQLTISVPKDKTKQITDILEKKKEIKRVVILTGLNCNQIIIYLSQHHVNELLNELDLNGFGVAQGIIAVNDLDIVKPVQTINKKHYYKFGHLSIEHIYMILSSSVGIDLDFVLYLIIATVIAGIGLATDDILMVMASMLLSPLMNPLLGITYSSVIRDYKLFKNSVKTLVISLLIVYTSGMLIGLSFHSFDDYYDWPTHEMSKRGESVGLITGLCIAIVSGIAAGISVTNGGINTLVGVAIAASIHPPLVNSAICVIHGFVSGGDIRREFTEIGGYSLILFIVNVCAIYIMGYLVFKFKGVKPFRRALTMWQFPKYTDLELEPNEEPPKNETDTFDSFEISNFQIRFKDTEGKDIIELIDTSTSNEDKPKEDNVNNEDVKINIPTTNTKDRSQKEIKDLLKVHMKEAQIIRKFIAKRVKQVRNERNKEISDKGPLVEKKKERTLAAKLKGKIKGKETEGKETEVKYNDVEKNN